MSKKDSLSQNFVKFTCPSCLKSEIKRTAHEREIGSKYECKQCGFTGPN
ncbi:RNA-binding protein [Candidatus Woesearchaeota archaeon]|nr:RNA-binding protein [Candidatus Woesearchaeota archaeon]